MDARRTLLELFDASLRAVDGRECVRRALQHVDWQWNFDVVAVGKAAVSMTHGIRALFSSGHSSTLVITKEGHGDPVLARAPAVRLIEAAHPVPDERSLLAGDELVRRLVHECRGFTVFLISGGASSLVEALQPGATLADLRELNERGLAAGWSIVELNARRTRLSRIKAGGVARLLGNRSACALFISDVPGDDVDVIGSGLLGRDRGQLDLIERRIIANVDMAVRAAVEAGAARGLNLEPCIARFTGEAAAVARDFVAALRATPADGLVWGGESTVTLPATVGRGGRNTHLALAAARLLGAGEPLTILAAGTDGTDGPTEDAGAIVDAGTIERAELAGVDVERAFRGFDSGTALEAAEDLLHTGPTGTNVGDLLIGIKGSATSVRDASRGRML